VLGLQGGKVRRRVAGGPGAWVLLICLNESRTVWCDGPPWQ